MKIAPYYKSLVEIALRTLESCEPTCFIGMFDSGTNYLFRLLSTTTQPQKLKNKNFISVDISGIRGEKMITEIIAKELEKVTKVSAPPGTYEELFPLIKEASQTKPVVISLNIGFEIVQGKKFYLFLNRLRNTLGWNFSYLIFANTGFVTHPFFRQPKLEKLPKRNLCPVIPLGKEETKIVLENYQERYAKELSKKVTKKIIKLSGGNPGILKALYLQAMESEGWSEPDIYDERLFFRLQRIIDDLPKKYQEVLDTYIIQKPIPNKQIKAFLKTFGFINSRGETFSPLLPQFLRLTKPFQDEREKVITTSLSKTERLVYKYLASKEGQIVKRDELAELVWGQLWTEKYSDWAIDQLIHGLREKLKKIKDSGEIKTKKAEGFLYIKNRNSLKDA